MKATLSLSLSLSHTNVGEVSLHLLSFHRRSLLLFISRVFELRSRRKDETRRYVKSPNRAEDSSVRRLNYANPPVWNNAAVTAATTARNDLHIAKICMPQRCKLHDRASGGDATSRSTESGVLHRFAQEGTA